MEPEYNVEKAQNRLDTVANAYDDREENSTLSMAMIKTTDYQLTYVDQPPSWRLIHAHNGDDTEEIFQLYGVLCASDLPPIESRNVASLKGKALCLRQGIRLTGFASGKFDDAMNNIEDMYKMLNSHMDHTKLQWEPATYEGYRAIDINARYFTARKTVPHEKGQAFERGVDPKGILAYIRGQDLIHGNDNKVAYLSESKECEGKHRMVRIEPSKFSIGDIVRATFSFVIFPTRENGAKMTLVLKALTLIETTPTKNDYKGIKKSAAIRRKVIFDDDRDLRERVANMTLQDDINQSDEY